jgi:hypothetical protein
MFMPRFASLVSIGAHQRLAGFADILLFPLEADNDAIEIGDGREAEPKHVPRTGGARPVSSAKLDVEDMAIASMKTIEAEVGFQIRFVRFSRPRLPPL